MKTRDFRDLVVWQRAVTLTRVSYGIAQRLPVEERFALAGQIRRSAVAVAANIAEGHASPHRREFVRYLGIAQCSLKELECHLLLCEEVRYTHGDVVANALAVSDEVSRMLRAMRRSLGEPEPGGPPLLAPRAALLAQTAPRRGEPQAAQHTERRNRSQS